ncbi:hypothetical protein PBY51_010217 [Eleginops maclovinus]|uniref:Uncharacterized protein n=1 Tax=Eleginops maclovinus TaxID=56733 RepID=A0AAN7XB57_ELEMC|nr:hypothetical protein PBY51_010217 [Eleginops maclovinus]
MLLPCRFCTRRSLICPINSSRSNQSSHSCPAIVKRGELQGSRPGPPRLPGLRRSCCGQEGGGLLSGRETACTAGTHGMGVAHRVGIAAVYRGESEGAVRLRVDSPRGE